AKTLYRIPDAVYERMEELHARTLDRADKEISNELRELIKQYPNIPALRNFLFSALKVRGKHQMAARVNDETLALFPDYFFARMNKVLEYLHKSQLENIPDLLGH